MAITVVGRWVLVVVVVVGNCVHLCALVYVNIFSFAISHIWAAIQTPTALLCTIIFSSLRL